MAEQQVEVEHKRLFEEWLDSAKNNTVLVNRTDLNTIKNYLISTRSGEECSITPVLKRRIKRNNFVIATFPGDMYCLCVLCESQVNS